jgi:hypothetical protein
MTDDSSYLAALEEIRVMRAKLKRIEDAAGVIEAPKVWTSRELGDRDTYVRNREAIHAAIAEGRVDLSEPEPPARVEYPPTDIPRLTQVGPGMFVSEPLPTSKGKKP